MLNVIRSDDSAFDASIDKLLARQSLNDENVWLQVRQIINDVRQRGDEALIEYTTKFDSHSENLVITEAECSAALDSITDEQRRALEFSADRIEKFHRHEVRQSWSYQDDDENILGVRVRPIERAGVYVPGGSASYPSSVLMNVIPAKIAGVKEVVMVTPTPEGKTNPMVLAAASISAVDTVYRIGGAQAIATLAYGTESIGKVDKITGPGNNYVATAKQMVFGQVGIDSIAGPSEILVIADQSANAQWVAADLCAQAEHDTDAQSILLTDSESLLKEVETALQSYVPNCKRRQIIQRSLQQNGAAIIVQSIEEICVVANQIAAEHVQIIHRQEEQIAEQLLHAGAIFLGAYSAEVFGDYCAGPNHVLPTCGTARFASSLSVADFQRHSTFSRLSKKGAQQIARHSMVVAESEQLDAHRAAAELRLQSKQS